MEQKIQKIFFLVAVIFTILNIRERFFSYKVRVRVSCYVHLKISSITEPLYPACLDLSDPGDEEVIRDGIPHVGVSLGHAGLQCNNSLQIRIWRGVRLLQGPQHQG